MSIGGRRKLTEIELRDWTAMADQAGLDADQVVQVVRELVVGVPDAVARAVDQELSAGYLTEQPAAFADRFRTAVAKQALMCRAVLAGARSPARRR
jgi:hypothetical protein